MKWFIRWIKWKLFGGENPAFILFREELDAADKLADPAARYLATVAARDKAFPNYKPVKLIYVEKLDGED